MSTFEIFLNKFTEKVLTFIIDESIISDENNVKEDMKMNFDFKLLLPIIILSLILVIIALVDLFKRDASEVRWNNKIIWVLIICLISTVGPIAYLVFGRTNN